MLGFLVLAHPTVESDLTQSKIRLTSESSQKACQIFMITTTVLHILTDI